MLALLAPRTSIAAEDRVWNIASSGNWNNGANWTPVGAPQSGDRVFATTISSQQVVIFFNDSANTNFYPSMLINCSGPGSMAVSQSAFTLAAGTMTIGLGGPGAYAMTGGTGAFTTVNLNGTGRISMSGSAQISTNTFNHIGTLTMTGGAITCANTYTDTGTLSTAGSGTIITATISAPAFVLNKSSFPVGLSVSQNLTLNAASTSFGGSFRSTMPSYTLAANRSVNVKQDVLLDAGTFIQNGNFTSTPIGIIGVLGSDTLMKAGSSWILQGGSNKGARLFVGSEGFGVATYTLNGAATCDFQGIQVASGASGAFVQSVGTVITQSLTVGGGTIGPSSGMYTLNSGTLNGGTVRIGIDGAASGAIKQNGGVATFGGALTINENANSRGEYTLTSGALSVAGRTISHGSFTQSGGVSTFTTSNYDGAGTVTVTGGTMHVSRLRQRTVSISGTGLIREREAGFFEIPTHRVESLTFETAAGNAINGAWDLGPCDLVVDYSSASPLANIKRYIASGYAGGSWTGTGLRSRTTQAFPLHNVGLGYAESSQVLGPNGGFYTDLAVDSTAVIVKLTYYGDTDLNGVVDFDDYAHIDNGFNNGGTDWFHGDFDYNGQVDFDDYSLIDLAFNTQSGTLRAVPEPAVASLLSIAAILRRRRAAR